MIPEWLHVLSIAALALGIACALELAIDVARHPQQMWIMNLVWPLTALFGTFFAVHAYFKYGRLATRGAVLHAQKEGRPPPNLTHTPFPAMVAKGTTHCGAGCALADIVAEWLVFFVPGVAVIFGWHSVFSHLVIATWVADYAFAFVFGIAFQYFTIAPMRGLGLGAGIWAALKADFLSLTAWQIGMYTFMAFAIFYLFGTVFETKLTAGSVEFWFMMQIAMIFGFLISYPVNWWLIESGIKERM